MHCRSLTCKLQTRSRPFCPSPPPCQGVWSESVRDSTSAFFGLCAWLDVACSSSRPSNVKQSVGLLLRQRYAITTTRPSCESHPRGCGRVYAYVLVLDETLTCKLNKTP